MKYIKQVVIILVVTFLGELLKYVIPLPIPASIYGFALMLIALKTGWISIDSVRETAIFLIEIMPLMFIPAAVGLMDSFETLRSMLIPVVVIIIVSTVAVMAISGKVTQFVIRLEKRNKK
ncbi:MAG: CidA/LrgA family protein [Velocimicrobium sp.]